MRCSDLGGHRLIFGSLNQYDGSENVNISSLPVIVQKDKVF